MIKLIDFHCHPDLYNDNFNLLKKAKYNNFSVIAMTNLPQLYKRYEDLFGGEESMKSLWVIIHSWLQIIRMKWKNF